MSVNFDGSLIYSINHALISSGLGAREFAGITIARLAAPPANNSSPLLMFPSSTADVI